MIVAVNVWFLAAHKNEEISTTGVETLQESPSITVR